MEPRLLKHWEETGLYHRIRASRDGRPTYILHDGPPYANGQYPSGARAEQAAEGLHRQVQNDGGI
ncbi:MAG: class I tRNA ligase family protein [Acidobacteriota bacterium]